METNVKQMSHKELIELVTALEARITKLEEPKTKSVSDREMTDDDAIRAAYGDLADKKHKEVAETLNLTYGQVYSARLEFTFKSVHKAMKAKGEKNRWVK